MAACSRARITSAESNADSAGLAPASSGQYSRIASRIVSRCHLPRSMVLPLNSTTVVPFTCRRHKLDHVFGELHQVVVVRIGLVELEHGEFGIVLGADALVAEIAIDLVHAIEPADHQPLQIELRRDAQKQVHVERIVMRLERPGRGAAGDLLHHRRFDFEKAALIKELPQRLAAPWRA